MEAFLYRFYAKSVQDLKQFLLEQNSIPSSSFLLHDFPSWFSKYEQIQGI